MALKLRFGLLIVVFFFPLVFSTNLYLPHGDCYEVNSNLTVCANDCQTVIENVTYSYNYTQVLDCNDFNTTYNLTCPEYNFSTLIDSVYDVRMDVGNASIDLRDTTNNMTSELEQLVLTFNITEKYANMYANWKGCSEEIQFYINETNRLKPFEDSSSKCSSDLSSISGRFDEVSVKFKDCDSQKWFFGFGGIFIGVIGYIIVNKRSVPQHSEVEPSKGDTPIVNNSKLDQAFDNIAKQIQNKVKESKGG